METPFIEIHKNRMDLSGFWEEQYKSVLIQSMENMYIKEVISEWGISDIVINGDKVLVKWYKRHRPLTDEEFEKKYGK